MGAGFALQLNNGEGMSSSSTALRELSTRLRRALCVSVAIAVGLYLLAVSSVSLSLEAIKVSCAGSSFESSCAGS